MRTDFQQGHRNTTALVAGLRMVLDGPIDGDWFEAYVTQVLIPEPRPDHMGIMANLSSCKRAAGREKLEAA